MPPYTPYGSTIAYNNLLNNQSQYYSAMTNHLDFQQGLGTFNAGLGVVNVGLQAWQAWNAYDQGKKQLKLAREQFDFNKTQAEKENKRYDALKEQRDKAHSTIAAGADVWNTPTNSNAMADNALNNNKKDELMPMERA